MRKYTSLLDLMKDSALVAIPARGGLVSTLNSGPSSSSAFQAP